MAKILLLICFYPVSLLVHYGMQSGDPLRMTVAIITMLAYSGMIGLLAGSLTTVLLKDQLLAEYRKMFKLIEENANLRANLNKK